MRPDLLALMPTWAAILLLLATLLAGLWVVRALFRALPKQQDAQLVNSEGHAIYDGSPRRRA